MVGIVGGRRPSIRQKSGTGMASGSSIVTTSTANNVLFNKPGPSVNQLGGSSVAPVSSSAQSAQNANTEYKLSIASMLLAMKNQTLGAYSLGGSKAGGSITENYSGVNLG